MLSHSLTTPAVTPHGAHLPRRQQRFVVRRDLPPLRGGPDCTGGQVECSSAAAELVADLMTLVDARHVRDDDVICYEPIVSDVLVLDSAASVATDGAVATKDGEQ
jgi:hypothetical protein